MSAGEAGARAVTPAPIAKGSSRPTVAEMIARRDEAMDQIRQLLVDKPLSVVDVAKRLGLPETTAYTYLSRLADSGEAYRTSERDVKHRALWAGTGRAPQQGSLDVTPGRGGERSTRTVPARQEGKTRDPLVAALFGPARSAAE